MIWTPNRRGVMFRLPNLPWSAKTPLRNALCLLPLTLALTLTPALGMGPMMLADESGYSVQCGECDAARCPELNYCEGTPIKDSCNCCTVCSSPKYQPHVSMVGESECGKIKCPKFQICVANMQGLPLCKCPSDFLCRRNRKRRRRRQMCGTNGLTYESRCHMRIASCNQGMMIRKKHRGACTPEDEKDVEIFKRKMRRSLRRRRRRRQKMEMERAAGVNGVDSVGTGEDGREDGVIGNGALTAVFETGRVGFNSEDKGTLLSNRNNDNMDVDEDSREGKVSKTRRRRRRKRQKLNKLTGERERDKKEKRKRRRSRRRRRRKRQHRPRTRPKRHRIGNTQYLDDAEARKKAFAKIFGQSTWWT